MGKALVLLLAVLFTPVDRLYAQMHMGATVDAQHVMFGPEFIPRRTDLPKQLIVAGGATVELDATSAFDYIEVSGTLRVSRAHDTTLTFTHLIVMPGGVLDVGTQADPIPCGVSVLFVIRNVPIDTTIDPYQWGNGLVNFGRQTRVGCAKTSFLEALGSLPAGTNQIALATAPNGWRVGDELLIPDTAPPSLVQNGITVSRRETPVTIAAINNSTVVLSKPLDFEHNTIIAPNGVAVVRPRVGNLTRNIVVQSEDQFGTRGHTADIGDDASWDVEYNALLGLGRTLAKPVDNTVLPHIGTNQIGKYAAHHHHANSSVGSIDRGNVIRGNPNTTKWAISVHGTSDALVEDNIAIDFPGAGVVTEDGYEVRNVFRHNMAAYIGASNAADLNVFAGQVDVQNGCPGCEGSGFWFHGVMNTFDRNEGWNSVRGINLFNQQQVAGLYPSQPGGMPDTPNDNHTMQPIAMTSNVAVANTVSGYEFWAVRRFPNVALVAANNWGIQADGVQSDGIDHFYQNPTIVCGNTTQIGILASKAYTGSFELQGGYVGGCNIGIMGGGGVNFENVTGATLQNATNMNLLPDHATFDHVTHLPLGNLPHTYLVMDNGDIRTLQPDLVWSGVGPLPRVGASRWAPQRGSQIIVHSWQGDGRDYQLFYKQQLGNLPAWYSAPAQHVWDPPIQGLTMQQSWDQLGMSYAGDVLAPSAAITLDGLAWGYARAGLTTTFSAPRAIVTFPTMREPALGPDGRDPSFTGYVRIWALNTGDPSAASDVTWYSVDDDPPVAWGSHGEVPDRLDDRSFNTPHADPGVHTVKMWRTGMDGVTQIASSVWTSQYFVSTPSIPPPTTVLVPNIVGSTQAIATSTLTAAGFVVGTVSSANSSSVAAGLVISQNPAGGSSAQAGTPVALVVSLGPAPTTPR
ncbi:MAG TPA: PASTA domain-containing protein, partial [Vicinamibacterales bacterium]|nr:PASTA domain-containing protein [Vicinamibacterales bacterium]